jgi:hypothetical protein
MPQFLVDQNADRQLGLVWTGTTQDGDIPGGLGGAQGHRISQEPQQT